MPKTLDGRGLACPAPVLLAKNTVEKEGLSQLDILVDNDAARENVTRFLQSRQFEVTDTRQGNDFLLQARRKGDAATPQPEEIHVQDDAAKSQQKIMIVVTSDRMGSGDDSLGEKLMVSFIKTIKEMGDDLWQLIFINSGVKLTVAQSPVLEELQEYENGGVTILACGTCLAHFGLTEAKEVGETTNMLDIVTAMQLAGKVIHMG